MSINKPTLSDLVIEFYQNLKSDLKGNSHESMNNQLDKLIEHRMMEVDHSKKFLLSMKKFYDFMIEIELDFNLNSNFIYLFFMIFWF